VNSRKLTQFQDHDSLFGRSTAIVLSLLLGLTTVVLLLQNLNDVQAAGPNSAPEVEPKRSGAGAALTLTVGVDPNYVPFSYISGTELMGFDIDLMDAIAAQLGAAVEYVPVAWSVIFGELIAGNLDAVISAVTITPQREEFIDFTLPYLEASDGSLIGIAVQQGDTEQRRMINEALWALRENGTLENNRSAVDAYFPEEDVSLPNWPLVNANTQTTLTYTDTQGSETVIQIPSGAVTETVMIEFTPTDTSTVPSAFSIMGQAFDLDAYRDGNFIEEQFTFVTPVTIMISYSASAVAGIDEEEILLEYWNEQTEMWEDAACGPYNRHPEDDWLAGPICHLSRFVFVEERYSVHLPLIRVN
jgi:hypothetical protein